MEVPQILWGTNIETFARKNLQKNDNFGLEWTRLQKGTKTHKPLTECTSWEAGIKTCEVLKIGYRTRRSRTDWETIERAA